MYRSAQALHAANLPEMGEDMLQKTLPHIQQAIQDISFQSWYLAEEVVPAYAKVDKTGIIGGIASYIEVVIDAGKGLFTSVGVEQGYGISIILFTMLGKYSLLLIYSIQLPISYYCNP